MAIEYMNRYGLSDGLFLVRPSSRTPGCHALSLVLRNQIYHYEIQVKVIVCLCGFFDDRLMQWIRSRDGITSTTDRCSGHLNTSLIIT